MPAFTFHDSGYSATAPTTFFCTIQLTTFPAHPHQFFTAPSPLSFTLSSSYQFLANL
jgi:hypothetical protein